MAAKKTAIRLQPKQIEFLSSPADIVIGGGAAGGGKSYALTVEPLRHIGVKGFDSVCFRRTYPEVVRPGGLWDEAVKLYPSFGGIPIQNRNEFLFPAQARLAYGYLLNEMALMNWKSSQVCLLMFDQLETFTERQFFYMLSRNRSSCGIRSYVRATANPEPGWLSDFLAWWIAEDGYADLNRSGKTRAFIRDGDDLVWADTKRELRDRYPDSDPKTVTFIPFTIYDNPALLQKDPGYLASLKALPSVDRERLLGDRLRGGNWKIKPAAGKVFREEWFEIVDRAPERGELVRYFDFAATEQSYLSKDPDYTSGVLIMKSGGYFYILDCFHRRVDAASVDRVTDAVFIQDAERAAQANNPYKARWEIEGGSAGKRDSAARTLRLRGIDAKGVSKTQDKVTAWKPLSAMAETGRVKILRGAWNKEFLEEMHGVPDVPHDDIADASAGAYNEIVNIVKRATSTQG